MSVWLILFIYFVAEQRRMKWNRRHGRSSPSWEEPSLGAWDNTECIDIFRGFHLLERTTKPARMSLLLYTTQSSFPSAGKFIDATEWCPRRKTDDVHPKGAFSWHSEHHLECPPFSQTSPFHCTSQMKPWVCQMKGEKERIDEGTLFWASYKSEAPSEKK